MQHPVKALGQRLVDGITVAQVDDDETRVRGDGGAVAALEVGRNKAQTSSVAPLPISEAFSRAMRRTSPEVAASPLASRLSRTTTS